MEFEIPIQAVPKARPRTFKTSGGISHTYTPKKTKDFEDFVRTWLQLKYKGNPIEGPINLKIKFSLKVPKSYTKKKRLECLSGGSNHFIKPDLDNLEKSVMDAAEGILYHNDSQICSKISSKRWSEEPLILLEIEPVKSLSLRF